MAHILEGDWRSFVIRNGDPQGDQNFHLVINDGGVIQQGSTHGGNAVTGNVVLGTMPGTRFHQIFIDKANPRKKYRGVLLVNGPQMIVCGVANLNPQVFLERKSGSKDDDLFNVFDQQQEVWVATKP